MKFIIFLLVISNLAYSASKDTFSTSKRGVFFSAFFDDIDADPEIAGGFHTSLRQCLAAALFERKPPRTREPLSENFIKAQSFSGEGSFKIEIASEDDIPSIKIKIADQLGIKGLREGSPFKDQLRSRAQFYIRLWANQEELIRGEVQPGSTLVFIVRERVNLDYNDADGLLEEAVSEQDIGKLEDALQQHAYVDYSYEEGGEPALNIAVHTNWFEGVQALVNAGADLNAHDSEERRPITSVKSDAILELLIEAGADLDVEDRYGMTALHNACRENNASMVKRLLDAGVSTQNWREELNVEFEDTTIIAGITNPTPLHWSVVKGNEDIVGMLLEAGADVNRGQEPVSYLGNDLDEEYGFTALHLAAMYGHDEILEKLLAEGADINAKTSKGKTPFMIAEQAGEITTAGILHRYQLSARRKKLASPLESSDEEETPHKRSRS